MDTSRVYHAAPSFGDRPLLGGRFMDPNKKRRYQKEQTINHEMQKKRK